MHIAICAAVEIINNSQTFSHSPINVLKYSFPDLKVTQTETNFCHTQGRLNRDAFSDMC